MTVTQAAPVFRVDVRTVVRAREDGEQPAGRLGRRVLIPRLPLLAVLGVTVESPSREPTTSAPANRQPPSAEEH